MRKLISIILLLLICNQWHAAAQVKLGEGARTIVGVSTRVINQTSLITLRDVNLNGANAVSGILSVSPITSMYAGLMRINASPNSQVRVTYLVNETLLDDNGTDGIVKARYMISGFSTDNQSASTLLDAGEAIVRIGPDGKYFIWLGAELNLTQAKPGSYMSEFIIELEANQ